MHFLYPHQCGVTILILVSVILLGHHECSCYFSTSAAVSSLVCLLLVWEYWSINKLHQCCTKKSNFYAVCHHLNSPFECLEHPVVYSDFNIPTSQILKHYQVSVTARLSLCSFIHCSLNSFSFILHGWLNGRAQRAVISGAVCLEAFS